MSVDWRVPCSGLHEFKTIDLYKNADDSRVSHEPLEGFTLYAHESACVECGRLESFVYED